VLLPPTVSKQKLLDNIGNSLHLQDTILVSRTFLVATSNYIVSIRIIKDYYLTKIFVCLFVFFLVCMKFTFYFSELIPKTFYQSILQS